MQLMAGINSLEIPCTRTYKFGNRFLAGMIIFICLLLAPGVSADDTDPDALLEEYRSIMDIAAFKDMENNSLLAGWQVFSGDGFPEDGQGAQTEAWSLNDAGAFCAGTSGPLSLVSPLAPVEDGLVSISGSIMAVGGGASRVVLRWMGEGKSLAQVVFRETPPAPDGRRRFNLSENERPVGADAFRLALIHVPEAGDDFCWQTARINALFNYVPALKLLYNRVGYEQIAPKKFTVWSNFPATEARFALADLTGEIVFQAPLGRAERISGAGGVTWEGYYYRGDFTNFEEEGAYTLTLSLDAHPPLAADIDIGFNLFWEKAFLPAVQPFERMRADELSVDAFPRLWNDPGLNSASDAVLLWSLVYSWSMLRLRFPEDPPLLLLEREAVYGADRVARWILEGNAEEMCRQEECGRYLNALSCIARFQKDRGDIFEAARQVLTLLMEEKKNDPWTFFAALDLYGATGDENYLVYALDIYPGLTLERVEALLDYESLTNTVVTVALQHAFTEMMDQLLSRADNPFGLTQSIAPPGSGFFTWTKDAKFPLLGSDSRVLSAMQTSLHAYRYTARKDYAAFAYDQLNWLLGNNPYGSCLISGMCGKDGPPVVVSGEKAPETSEGLVLHGVGPREADLDLPRFAATPDDGPTENTNGYSLYNNVLYIQALASLKRIPIARPRP